MALPFIIWGAAAAAAALGAKKAYDGYEKKSQAEDILEDARHLYKRHKESFDKTESDMLKSLDNYGYTKLSIGKDFGEFERIVKDLIPRLKEDQKKALNIGIPQHSINKIQDLSISAVGYLGTMTGAGAVGVAAGFATYGGVMTLGAASTGTAITSLSGAAAYNATMAALGGGSLATGGLGMAGGSLVLGTAVAAPILLIAGWAYNSHAEKAFDSACQTTLEVDSAVEKMTSAESRLNEIKEYVDRLNLHVREICAVFVNHYFEPLKFMHAESIKGQANNVADDILRLVMDGYELAAIITDIVTKPLFKPVIQENGEIVITDGVIQEQTDSNGMKMLNKEVLDEELRVSATKFKKFSI